MARSLVFDTGPIISLTLNNLLWLIEPLQKRFGGDFFITKAVYRELIERPLSTKKYKFEALQVLPLISRGIIKMLDDKQVSDQAKELIDIANTTFSAHGNWIRIVHPGEVEVIAAALKKGSQAIVIDERTTRDLIENPRLIEKRLRRKLHTNISTDKKNLRLISKRLKGLRVIRSFELAKVAFDLGLLDRYMLRDENELVPDLRRAVLEGVLWAVKLSGCSVRGEDIAQVLKSIKQVS
jgi:hypothetical protein